MRVWLIAWEWEDDGEDFGVGSEVEWYLFPLSHEERVYNLEPLGEELLGSITHSTSPDELIPAKAVGGGSDAGPSRVAQRRLLQVGSDPLVEAALRPTGARQLGAEDRHLAGTSHVSASCRQRRAGGARAAGL